MATNIRQTLQLLAPQASGDWRDDALCAEVDPEAFFPEKGGSTREAKKVCSVCPVSAECLDDALDTDDRFGVRGGLSERERRAIKKKLEDETAPGETPGKTPAADDPAARPASAEETAA